MVSAITFTSPSLLVATASSELNETNDQMTRTVELAQGLGSVQPCRRATRGIRGFIRLHPVAAKIFFFCHILSFGGIVMSIPKLIKHGRRFVQRTGMERFDAAMKIFAKLGEISVYAATVAVGLEAFHVGAHLANWGMKKLLTVYKTMGACLSIFVIVGTVFSAAQLVIDGRKWWKTRQFQKGFQAKEWYRRDASYTAKEYACFKAHLQTMTQEEERRFGKALLVDGANLRKALLARLARDEPTENDLTQMNQLIQRMQGQLKVAQTYHLVTAFSDLTGLTATALLLVPKLQPLAAVLAVTGAVTLAASSLYSGVKQYQFEDNLGMIQRQAPPKMNRRARLIDYTKWQLGWYEEQSLLKRLMSAGSNAWEGTLLCGEALNAILRAIATFAQILG